MLVWLIVDHHWSVPAAGVLVTVAQLIGALGRIAVGWCRIVGSVTMSPLAEAAMVVATVIAVGYNGLAATAITEYAGPFWSGRALGVQNTAQRVMAAATPPAFGALITAVSYPVAFAVCALFPLLAVPVVPVKSERTG